MALSAVTGLWVSGELGTESPSLEKYPLDERRGGSGGHTPRRSGREMTLVLHQEGDRGSPPPADPGRPELRSARLLAGFDWLVCAESPAAPADGGSPSLSSVTVVEPSGLLDEQSTVSLLPAQRAYSLLHLELQLDMLKRTATAGATLKHFLSVISDYCH